jgi:hypothetical protein
VPATRNLSTKAVGYRSTSPSISDVERYRENISEEAKIIEAGESEANKTEIHEFGYGKLSVNKMTKACSGRTFSNDRTIIIRVCMMARILRNLVGLKALFRNRANLRASYLL